MSDVIQEDFERFHEQNPHVVERLEALAREWFASGNQKVSIKMLWELLRWDVGTQTVRQSPFKLKNAYHSRYARLILQRNPEWVDRINVRPLRAL